MWKIFVGLQAVRAGFRDDPENNKDKNCPVGTQVKIISLRF